MENNIEHSGFWGLPIEYPKRLLDLLTDDSSSLSEQDIYIMKSKLESGVKVDKINYDWDIIN